MKKFRLIALLVAVMMVCQSFAAATVFAANDSELTTAQISEQAIDFLETVGAITVDKEWDAAGLIGPVTRTYAATVFANIIRGRQTTHYPVVEPILSDVPAGKGNADNIFLAVAYDVIPEIDGKFNEKGNFTFADMKYAVTSLLGYVNYAKATGLGDAEITKLVAQEEIFDGVNYKATMALTKTEFAIVLKNALHAEMIYQLNYSPESFEFDKNSGVTMMEEYLGVAEYEGIITQTPYSALANNQGCQEDEVILGDMRCKINSTNAADFIGCKVRAYVKEYDDDVKINDILISDYAPDVQVLTIDAEMLNTSASGFRLTSIAYEDAKGRNKKANVSATADYFYNGVACDLTVADFRINSGAVTLISNNGSSTYNVVKIDTYENFVVDYVDADDVVYSKLGTDHKLNLNEDEVEFVDIRRTNNRVVKITQLKEDNVLSVYKSKDGNYVKAILSTTVLDGEIVGIDESGMRTVFSIDNGSEVSNVEAYFMGTDWEHNYTNAFKYPEKNFEGTFYLDASGYLTYAEISPVLVQYGYVTGVLKKSGLDGTVVVQLVDETGITRELEVPEKGVRTNDYIGRVDTNEKYLPETVYEILTETNTSSGYPADIYRLVRFKANSKNNLTKLDFAYDM
ncbi:MAG: hypothetical protein IJ365_02630, partial [Clostridia bacterium]|nr:hypothetical protein [Clostridia bacterium]